MRQMKDSGVKWIENIPSDWTIVPLKWIVKFGKGLPITKDNLVEQGVPVVSYGQIHSKTNSGTHLGKDLMRFVNEKYLQSNPSSLGKKGDIFFADTSEDYAGVGNAVLVDGDEPVFAGYHTVIVRPIDLLYSKYLAYLFLTDAWRSQLCSRVSGIKVFSVTQGLLKETTVILPPTEKIATMTDYLDRKCAEIDAIIAKQQHIIEKLKEYKLSVITEAVTKGLNPNVPMKDSGVEWIGKIPEHWKIIKMKFLGKTRNGLTYSPEDLRDETDGILVLRSANIQNGKLDFTDKIYVSCPVKDELMVKKGDILICSRNGSRKLIGKNVIINTDISASFGAFMMIFRTPYNSEYIRYILNSDVFSYYLGTFLTSTINQLTRNNFDNMVIPFTFNNEEQKYLVMYLKNRCDKIDELIRNKQVEIETLYKYKKSLIYEVVTGKMEV